MTMLVFVRCPSQVCVIHHW